jgi:hypothetical protein
MKRTLAVSIFAAGSLAVAPVIASDITSILPAAAQTGATDPLPAEQPAPTGNTGNEDNLSIVPASAAAEDSMSTGSSSIGSSQGSASEKPDSFGRDDVSSPAQ